jgi:hypothetical protein
MGVSAYAGYYWPVMEDGAAKFTEIFYTGSSAVFYGDATSGERPNLAKAE